MTTYTYTQAINWQVLLVRSQNCIFRWLTMAITTPYLNRATSLPCFVIGGSGNLVAIVASIVDDALETRLPNW